MKRYLKAPLGYAIAVLMAIGLAAPSEAGWNVRQNDDGTTDWVRQDSKNVEDTTSVGEVFLTVRIPKVATPGTVAITIPVTDAKVTFIQSVLTGALTGSNTILRFWNLAAGQTLAALANATTSKEISNTTSRMTIAATAAGGSRAIVAIAVTGTVDTFTPTTNNRLERGSVILIHTNGGSSDTHHNSADASRPTDAIITITLKKR